MALVIIGKIYDIDGEQVTELDGWHVNSTELLEGLDGYSVTPENPRQVIFGVETFFYRFDSEAQANEILHLTDTQEL